MYSAVGRAFWSSWHPFLRSPATPVKSRFLVGVMSGISRSQSNLYTVRTSFPVLKDEFMQLCASCSRRLFSGQSSTNAIFSRTIHSGSQSSNKPSSSFRSNLLIYGLVAFLWEREKITNDEILKCVQDYEEKQQRLYSPIATTSVTSSNPQTASTNSPRKEVDAESVSESTSPNSQQDETSEQRKKLFLDQLTDHYQSHTNERVSSLPLVGIRSSTPRSYVVSNIMVERLQSSAFRAVGKVRQIAVDMSSLKRNNGGKLVENEAKTSTNDVHERFSDLACIGAELHIESVGTHSSDDTGDWFEFVLANQDRFKSTFDQSDSSNVTGSYYPLVGLRERKANILDKFLKRLTTPSVIDTLRSIDLNQMFDNVLGVDVRFNTALLALVQETRRSLGTFAVQFLDRSMEVLESARCVKSVGVASNKERNVVENESEDNHEKTKLQGHLAPPTSFDSWEFFAKTKSCTVYRKQFEDTGLYQFKVIGRYHDITAKDFYDVQVDKEARKAWDEYATSLDVIDRDPQSGTEVVHWIMRYPFPMSSREYVFTRKGWISPEKNVIVQFSRSVLHPAAPETSKSVRIDKYFSEMVIKAHSSIELPGFDFELTYFDDPKVFLPSSCVNWATTTAMPDFLSKIHNAAATRRHQKLFNSETHNMAV